MDSKDSFSVQVVKYEQQPFFELALQVALAEAERSRFTSQSDGTSPEFPQYNARISNHKNTVNNERALGRIKERHVSPPRRQHNSTMSMQEFNERSPLKYSISSITDHRKNTSCAMNEDVDDIDIHTDNDSDDSGDFANVKERRKKPSPSVHATKKRTVRRKTPKRRTRPGMINKRFAKRTRGAALKQRNRTASLRNSRTSKKENDDSEWESVTDSELSEETIGQTEQKKGKVGSDQEEESELRIPMQRQLERTIAKGTAKNKLSVTNVKVILRSLITNDLVKNMLRSTLKGPAEDLPDGVVVYEPKLTRSRFKEVLQKEKNPILWPISPIKLGQQAATGPRILDVEFPEEEDDAEYEPTRDLEDADSDDESLTSQVSERGASPFSFTSPTPSSSSRWLPSTPTTPRTIWPSHPTTPVPNPHTPVAEGSRKESQNEVARSPMGPPLAPAISSHGTKKCLFTSDAEDDGIARRTRSKLPLTTTSLTDIEEAFVAPDITPDMYDTLCDDTDWQEFLKSLHHSEGGDIQNEDDDPEFNYLAEAEKEEMEAEDDRYEAPLRVSRKELNSLMEELEDLFDDDYTVIGLCTPNRHSPSTHIPAARKTADAEDTLEEEREEVDLSATPKKAKAVRWKKFGQRPRPLTPPEKTDSNSGCMILDHQIRQLQQQMRQHVQLMTQMYILAQGSNGYDSIANDCKMMLNELNLLRCLSRAGPSSVFRVFNLAQALDTINSAINWAVYRRSREEEEKEVADHIQKMENRTRKDSTMNLASAESSKSKKNGYHRCVGRFRKVLLEVQKEVIWRSKVFMYPSLLPHYGLVSCLALDQLPRRLEFCPSETTLLVLGVDQFRHLGRVACFHLIHTHMIPAKTEAQLNAYFTSSQDRPSKNVLVKYKLEGELPQIPREVEEFSEDMVKAPCDQPVSVLPHWCQALKRQEEVARRKQEKEERFAHRMAESRKRAAERRRQRDQKERKKREEALQNRILQVQDSISTLVTLRHRLQSAGHTSETSDVVEIIGSEEEEQQGVEMERNQSETDRTERQMLDTERPRADCDSFRHQHPGIVGSESNSPSPNIPPSLPHMSSSSPHISSSSLHGSISATCLSSSSPSDSRPFVVITATNIFIPISLADISKVKVAVANGQLPAALLREHGFEPGDWCTKQSRQTIDCPVETSPHKITVEQSCLEKKRVELETSEVSPLSSEASQSLMHTLVTSDVVSEHSLTVHHASQQSSHSADLNHSSIQRENPQKETVAACVEISEETDMSLVLESLHSSFHREIVKKRLQKFSEALDNYSWSSPVLSQRQLVDSSLTDGSSSVKDPIISETYRPAVVNVETDSTSAYTETAGQTVTEPPLMACSTAGSTIVEAEGSLAEADAVVEDSLFREKCAIVIGDCSPKGSGLEETQSQSVVPDDSYLLRDGALVITDRPVGSVFGGEPIPSSNNSAGNLASATEEKQGISRVTSSEMNPAETNKAPSMMASTLAENNDPTEISSGLSEISNPTEMTSVLAETRDLTKMVSMGNVIVYMEPADSASGIQTHQQRGQPGSNSSSEHNSEGCPTTIPVGQSVTSHSCQSVEGEWTVNMLLPSVELDVTECMSVGLENCTAEDRCLSVEQTEAEKRAASVKQNAADDGCLSVNPNVIEQSFLLSVRQNAAEDAKSVKKSMREQTAARKRTRPSVEQETRDHTVAGDKALKSLEQSMREQTAASNRTWSYMEQNIGERAASDRYPTPEEEDVREDTSEEHRDTETTASADEQASSAEHAPADRKPSVEPLVVLMKLEEEVEIPSNTTPGCEENHVDQSHAGNQAWSQVAAQGGSSSTLSTTPLFDDSVSSTSEDLGHGLDLATSPACASVTKLNMLELIVSEPGILEPQKNCGQSSSPSHCDDSGVKALEICERLSSFSSCDASADNTKHCPCAKQSDTFGTAFLRKRVGASVTTVWALDMTPLTLVPSLSAPHAKEKKKEEQTGDSHQMLQEGEDLLTQNAKCEEQSHKRQEKWPSQNRQEMSPSQNRQEMSPSQNRQEMSPSQNRQEVSPSQNRQEMSPSQNRQEMSPSQNRQKVSPSQNRQEMLPSQNRQEMLPSQNRQEMSPSQNRQEMLPSQNRQEMSPSQNVQGEQPGQKKQELQSQNRPEKPPSQNEHDVQPNRKKKQQISSQNEHVVQPIQNKKGKLPSQNRQGEHPGLNEDEQTNKQEETRRLDKPANAQNDSGQREHSSQSLELLCQDQSNQSDLSPTDQIYLSSLEDCGLQIKFEDASFEENVQPRRTEPLFQVRVQSPRRRKARRARRGYMQAEKSSLQPTEKKPIPSSSSSLKNKRKWSTTKIVSELPLASQDDGHSDIQTLGSATKKSRSSGKKKTIAVSPRALAPFPHKHPSSFKDSTNKVHIQGVEAGGSAETKKSCFYHQTENRENKLGHSYRILSTLLCEPLAGPGDEYHRATQTAGSNISPAPSQNLVLPHESPATDLSQKTPVSVSSCRSRASVPCQQAPAFAVSNESQSGVFSKKSQATAPFQKSEAAALSHKSKAPAVYSNSEAAAFANIYEAAAVSSDSQATGIPKSSSQDHNFASSLRDNGELVMHEEALSQTQISPAMFEYLEPQEINTLKGPQLSKMIVFESFGVKSSQAYNTGGHRSVVKHSQEGKLQGPQKKHPHTSQASETQNFFVKHQPGEERVKGEACAVKGLHTRGSCHTTEPPVDPQCDSKTGRSGLSPAKQTELLSKAGKYQYSPMKCLSLNKTSKAKSSPSKCSSIGVICKAQNSTVKNTFLCKTKQAQNSTVKNASLCTNNQAQNFPEKSPTKTSEYQKSAMKRPTPSENCMCKAPPVKRFCQRKADKSNDSSSENPHSEKGKSQNALVTSLHTGRSSTSHNSPLQNMSASESGSSQNISVHDIMESSSQLPNRKRPCVKTRQCQGSVVIRLPDSQPPKSHPSAVNVKQLSQYSRLLSDSQNKEHMRTTAVSTLSAASFQSGAECWSAKTAVIPQSVSVVQESTSCGAVIRPQVSSAQIQTAVAQQSRSLPVTEQSMTLPIAEQSRTFSVASIDLSTALPAVSVSKASEEAPLRTFIHPGSSASTSAIAVSCLPVIMSPDIQVKDTGYLSTDKGGTPCVQAKEY